MLLADELSCLAHDDRSRPRTPRRAADLGLAAALLGELVLADRITLRVGTLMIQNNAPLSDHLASKVLDQIVSNASTARRASGWPQWRAGRSMLWANGWSGLVW